MGDFGAHDILVKLVSMHALYSRMLEWNLEWKERIGSERDTHSFLGLDMLANSGTRTSSNERDTDGRVLSFVWVQGWQVGKVEGARVADSLQNTRGVEVADWLCRSGAVIGGRRALGGCYCGCKGAGVGELVGTEAGGELDVFVSFVISCMSRGEYRDAGLPLAWNR